MNTCSLFARQRDETSSADPLQTHACVCQWKGRVLSHMIGRWCAACSRSTLGRGPGNAHTTVLKQRLSELLRGCSVAHHGLLARPSWPHPQPHRPGSAAQQDHPADLKLSRLTSHLGCARLSAAPLGFARPSAARTLDYLVPADSRACVPIAPDRCCPQSSPVVLDR